MQPLPPIDPELFIRTMQPLLEKRDLARLHETLKTRWHPSQLQALVRSGHADAKKVALLAVGLVGTACCIPELSEQLKDPDPVSRAVAEHALWSIWFRQGSPEANHEIARGAQALERREHERAIQHFTRAIELCPDFAEAYNQRALTFYMLERYEDSMRDCCETLTRMPQHFGALAGLGHCHAHLGQRDEAVACYERALAINPHLDCVRQAVCALKNNCDHK